MFLRFASGVAISLFAWTSAAHADVSGSVRTGLEWDDNALRVEGAEAVDDFLARYFTTLTLQYPVVPRSAVVVDVSHGGKFFLSQADADTLLTQAYVGYQQRVVDVFGVYAQLDLKDRTERISRRDYIRTGIGAGVDVFVGPASVRAGLATRYFAFKPAADASSSNVEASSRARWDFPHAIYASAGYTYAQRVFQTNRYVLDGDEIVLDSAPRSDAYHVFSVSAGWRGPVVVDATYQYALNDSNSYGQNLRRHAADLTATAALPWSLFLSGHLELQRTTYDDAVLIDADFLVDEDNRNSIVGSLARGIGDAIEVELRYALYLQEFGVGSDYSRQTVMLAVGYLF